MSHFSLRPRNEAERAAMQSHVVKEMEYDDWNEVQVQMMNKEHLSKAKTNSCESMVKRWRKESARMLKRININTCKFYSFNRARTWLPGV